MKRILLVLITIGGVIALLTLVKLEAKDSLSKKNNKEKIVLAQLDQQILEIKKMNDILKVNRENLLKELDSLKLDRADVLDNLKKITKENMSLKDQVNNLQEALVVLANDKKAVDKKVEDLEKKDPAKNLKKEIKELKDKNDNLKDQLDSLKKDKAALDAKQGVVRTLKEEIKKEKDINNNLRKELESVNASRGKDLAKQDEYVNSLIKKFKSATEEIMVLRVDMINACYNLGVLLQERGKTKEAIVEYTKVLKINPNDASSHFNLALLYDTVLDDRVKAREHYLRYLEINPEAKDKGKVQERIDDLEMEKAIWKNDTYRDKKKMDKKDTRW